ncbi:cadherin-like domain-containing protein [Vibrio lentus]|nr:cadherin-like domain-containing protein [Vibrio lentus]
MSISNRHTLVDNQDGTYTITPNANFHGIIPLTGMVSDGTASTPLPINS